MKKIFLFLTIAVIAYSKTFSQMYVTRNNILDPFLDSTVTKGFFPGVNYSHEFSRGYGSIGSELAWNGRSTGFIEFYRWENNFSLGGVLAAEAGINNLNDIGFNPRSIRWMEEFSLFKKEENFVWEIGVQHQCKHDVDNSDAPNNDIPDTNFSRKRVTILSGLHAAMQSNKFSFLGHFQNKISLRTDYYFSSSDYRFPVSSVGRDLENARLGILLSDKIIFPMTNLVELYANGWLGTMIFTKTSERDNSTEPEFNYRAEFGVDLRGSAGKLDIFLATEKYFDDLSSPVPQSSNVLYLGIRGSGKFFF